MYRKVLILIFLSTTIIAFSQFNGTIITSGNDLDNLWTEYFRTGDVDAVTQIMNVLNWPDLMRSHINITLDSQLQNDNRNKLVTILTELGFLIDQSAQSLVFQGDVDILFGVLLQDAEYRDIIRELFYLTATPKELVINLGLKSAAFWSLLANSRQHPDVKRIVDQKKVVFKLTIQQMLDQYSK